MKNALLLLSISYLGLGLGGCSAIDPKIIEALGKDPASICVVGDARGGAGGIIGGATGGYGQSTLVLCRSGAPNAKITAAPDGSITIQHGN